MSRVDVTIDRLVLSGMNPIQRTAFVEGLRAELATMLATPEGRTALGKSGRTPVLRLGRVTMMPGPSGARRLGRQVARAAARGGKR